MASEAKCCICDRTLATVIDYSEYDSDETRNDVGIAAKMQDRALCAACRREGKTARSDESSVESPVQSRRIEPTQPRKATARDLIAKAARDLRNAMIDRNRKKTKR